MSATEWTIWDQPHCWHPAPTQHLVPNHRDVFCCWCAVRRCQTLYAVPDAGHGPHAPKVSKPPPEWDACPVRSQRPSAKDPPREESRDGR